METKERRPAPGLERHLGYWLRRVSNHVSGEFKRALQSRNTSVAEWVVLCHVDEHPGITPGELAATLDLTRGAVSKVIDKLEAKQWITAPAHQTDKRVRLISLTGKGSRVLPKLRRLADHNDQNFFSVLQPAEKDELKRILAKLIDSHQMHTVAIE